MIEHFPSNNLQDNLRLTIPCILVRALALHFGVHLVVATTTIVQHSTIGMDPWVKSGSYPAAVVQTKHLESSLDISQALFQRSFPASNHILKVFAAYGTMVFAAVSKGLIFVSNRATIKRSDSQQQRSARAKLACLAALVSDF